MALAKDALQIARSLLNDDLGTKWPDSVLFPRLQTAHRQMQSVLALNSISVTKVQSAIITVPALAVDLGANQPDGLIDPISMQERSPGGSADDFADMIEVAFIPTLSQDSTLVYWAWLGGLVRLLGATTIREVMLRYTKTLTVPQTVNDVIGVILGELYLGYKVASMCGDNATALSQQADNELEILIRTNVKGMQGIAHRRRPYRSRGR